MYIDTEDGLRMELYYLCSDKKALICCAVIQNASISHDARITVSTVGRVPDFSSQGRGFESYFERGVVSVSKTLRLHCLGLVQLRKTSRHD